MSETTPSLDMPYILPDQAQKHVTHNEALQRLDALVQLVLTDIVSGAPANPAEGECFGIRTAGPTGDFQDRGGQIACFIDGSWIFARPRTGWLAWNAATRRPVYYDGSEWQPLISLSQMDQLGINATADSTNRLSVSAPASLFNHQGGSHQMKVNRAAEANTASLLFQTGFSGRGEFGLLGDLNIGLKVSTDGTNWKRAFQVDPNGVVRNPSNPACRAHLNATAMSPPAGTFTGFQSLSLNQGGFTLGGAATPGIGQKLVVPATGLYRLTFTMLALTSSGHVMTLLQNGVTPLLTARGLGSLATIPQQASTIASLAAGDTLQFQHSGTAQLDFGPGKTELLADFL